MPTETVKEISTVITREHSTIAQEFIAQVISFLSAGDHKILAYQICNEQWSKQQSLKIKIDDQKTLTVQITG